MRVVNVAGFPFSVLYRGRPVVVPFDNLSYYVPDDFGFYKELRVVEAPAPIPPPIIESVVEVTDVVLENAKSNTNIKKPLSGVKIKKKKRDDLLTQKKQKRIKKSTINKE